MAAESHHFHGIADPQYLSKKDSREYWIISRGGMISLLAHPLSRQ